MRKYEFSKEQLALMEEMRQPFVVCQFLEKNVVTLAVSDGFCKMFGYKDRAQAYSDMNRNMYKYMHPDDTAMFTNAILRFGTGNDPLEIVYRTKKIDSSGYTVIHMCGEHVDKEDGLRLAQIWFTDEGDYQEENDTDQIRGMNSVLRKEDRDTASHYDYLTGLPDMTYFYENAEVGRKVLLDQGGSPVLLYINLRGMKHYNHKYGYNEGDKLLRYFSRLLSQIFRVECCCHISADRFSVFTDENGLEEKLEDLFHQWRKMNDERHLPVCVGIYPNRMEEVMVGMAFDRAKIACDAISGTYASAFNYFSNELNDVIEKQQYILENFEKALAENWIQVYYQPIVRAINGKVCDEEALARWIDPEKGFLSPADFIPYLEDAGLIYKLDLYVIDKVLEHIKIKEKKGFYIMPHSINLSRSDFDACDMVEEIRTRVDAAGVNRDRISIEITESVIGSDFEFMKTQIERFQKLGFPVWMDDFGSGYSSLDVLQSIKFNLLKFDMEFMRKLDESSDGRIILTELMKMALALGIDTICEGVETKDQVHFLQEIGCSKLQGFYFSRPNPIERILDYHVSSKLTGYENPQESLYYELLCGVNLYDVGVIAHEEKSTLQNTYNTLPMCIIEVKDDRSRFVRTNQSYRDFFKHFFGIELAELSQDYIKYGAAFMQNVVKTCCEKGIRTFYDEKMPDGSIIHSFARRIGINPVTGNIAIAIAVLSIREPNEKLMIEQVLSVVEEFGEGMPGGFFIYKADENEELLYANKAVCEIFGCENLEEFKALTGFTFRGMVHPDDYERISVSIDDQVKESQFDLDFVEYRIIRKDGEIRWLNDYGHYVEYDDQNSLYYVFISDITDKYEKAESDKALRAAVIEALTKAYDSVWLISDIKTQQFELFRISKEMEHFMPANMAIKNKKFTQAAEFYSQLVLEEDRGRFIEAVSPESIMKNTEDRVLYSVPFRRVFEKGIRNYRLEFTRLDLPDGKTGIVAGFRDMDEMRIEG
ncbi:MAG: EAL domain-containing protein [Parasporobacterium sp.]|nr:EAL domain-containing protein [Parasporobacterium sp.]